MNVAELGYEIDSRDAVTATRNLDDMADAAGGAQSQAERLTRRLATLAGTIGTAAAAGRAFNRGFALDQSMGELATLLPGMESDLRAIEASSFSMARQFGTDTRTQVVSFYDAVSAGASSASEAIAQMDAANRLAIGGAAELDPALSILNTSVNAYAQSNLTAADAADTLFTGVRFGVTTIDELSTTMGRSIPVASTLGVEFYELVALIAALTTQGQDSALAVTGVTAALSQIIAPSEEARRLARELGLEFSAAGVQAMSFAEFLNEVIDATGGSEEQLASLFGSVEARRAVLSLAGQGGVVFNEILAEMENRTGAADAAFNEMAKRASEKWNRAMSNLNSVNDQLGLTLLNIVAPAALEVTNAMVGAEDASLALEIALKAVASTAAVLGTVHIASVTASFLAATPAVRAYIAAVALVGPVSATATVATTALSASLRVLMGPAGLVLTAVGALTAAWVMYGDAQDEARWATEEMNDLLREREELEQSATRNTREGAAALLENALAIRARTDAILEQRRAELQYEQSQFRSARRGFGPTASAISDNRSIELLNTQSEIDSILASQAENMAEIADLERILAELRAGEARTRREAAEAAEAEFQLIITGYRDERNALTLSREEREARLAVLDAEAKLGRDLTDEQERLLRTEVQLLRERENYIDVGDRLTASVYEYRNEIMALDRLYRLGATSAAEYWDAVFDSRLVQGSRDLDAYLRGAGANLSLNGIDGELAANDNDPFASGIGDPALASDQEELIRLQEQYYERQRILQEMRDADIISMERYQERLTALERAGAAERVEIERRAYAIQMGAASSAFDSIAQATAAFAGEQSGIYRAMFAVSKAFAIAESMINIQQALSEALALPFPANIPAMGVVAAQGASIIANLQAVAATGFRHGGWTGDIPEHVIAGVVHGQEYVMDARATRQIGRENLEYMARTGSIPANDQRSGGAGSSVTNIYDMRGAMVTRDAMEEVEARQGRLEARVAQSEQELPRRVQEIQDTARELGAA